MLTPTVASRRADARGDGEGSDMTARSTGTTPDRARTKDRDSTGATGTTDDKANHKAPPRNKICGAAGAPEPPKPAVNYGRPQEHKPCGGAELDYYLSLPRSTLRARGLPDRADRRGGGERWVSALW